MIEIRLDESEGGDTSTFDTPEIFISKDAIGNALDVTEALTHSADLLSFEEVFQLGLPAWHCLRPVCSVPVWSPPARLTDRDGFADWGKGFEVPKQAAKLAKFWAARRWRVSRR